MLKVAIFSVGYLWDFDLRSVAKMLNRNSQTFTVDIISPVRNIGDADIYGFGFSFSKLFDLFPPNAQYDIQIGITSVPLEGNYYGYNEEGSDNIIYSLHDIDEVCEKAKSSREEYAVYATVTSILWHQYHDKLPDGHYMDLFHDDIRGCLFDFCGNKPDLAVGLRAKTIDSICRGKLIAANISEHLVEDCERVLQRLRTPTFIGSVHQGLNNPRFSFLFGGIVFGLLINVSSSLLLGDFDSKTDLWVIVVIIFAALCLLIVNYVFQLRDSKRRSYA